MSTRIYHVTYYVDLRSAYVQFAGCNFSCPWCIRRLTPWDHHLDGKTLNSLRHGGFLTLDGFFQLARRLAETYGMAEAVLGGEEPTLDASLPKIVEFLSSSSIRVRLLTNGYHIGGDLLEALRSCAACEVVVGLKTPDPVKHLKYTGKPLAPVLQNVKRLLGAGIKVSFETVLIPGLNGVREVEELARIIGEMAGRAVLVIDPLVPVPGVQWRRPSDEEVREAVERASRYVEAKTHTAGGRASRAVVVFPRKQYLNMGQ